MPTAGCAYAHIFKKADSQKSLRVKDLQVLQMAIAGATKTVLYITLLTFFTYRVAHFVGLNDTLHCTWRN